MMKDGVRLKSGRTCWGFDLCLRYRLSTHMRPCWTARKVSGRSSMHWKGFSGSRTTLPSAGSSRAAAASGLLQFPCTALALQTLLTGYRAKHLCTCGLVGCPNRRDEWNASKTQAGCTPEWTLCPPPAAAAPVDQWYLTYDILPWLYH